MSEVANLQFDDSFFDALSEAVAAYDEARKFDTSKFHDSLLSGRIADLFDAQNKEPSPYRFFKVCETVSDCYPEDLGTDKDILAHTLTPILIRYVVGAMRGYYRDAESGLSSSEKASLLAKVMGLQGSKRGGARNGTRTQEEEALLVFVFCRDVGHRLARGDDHKVAFSAEFPFLYRSRFGSDSLDGRDPRQCERNRIRLLEILRSNGVVVPLSDEEARQAISS